MTDLAAWLSARASDTGDLQASPSPKAAAKLRLIAFYLPQYHPIPENDEWWGKGFTEWRNVVRGRPLFQGHYQPHLPAELGFYDLRVQETREAQAELAREHGIFGFCYYHYWFAGKRLLDRPFREVLESGQPEFPFCLCWANENWSRRWDGSNNEILIRQRHSPEDDLQFIEALFPAFEDERYIRVDGKPLLLVYRPSLLPDVRATAGRWRRAALAAGIGDLFLCNVHSFDTTDPREIEFDAAVEFPPNLKPLPRSKGVRMLEPEFCGHLLDYELPPRLRTPTYTLFRGVTPMWDNTARRLAGATVLVGSSPERYGRWLQDVCTYTRAALPPTQQLVFVNAWNEWAEGCHLEPDAKYGRAYLERTREVLADAANVDERQAW